MATVFWIIGGAAVWLAIGAGFYLPAAISWKRRWGADDVPPFGNWGGALLGPCAIGAALAEWQIARSDPWRD